MAYLPYHHDWEPAYETDLGLRVHWFGRYAGFPEWSVERSRLAADMISFFFVESECCWVVVNGVKLELKAGDSAMHSICRACSRCTSASLRGTTGRPDRKDRHRRSPPDTPCHRERSGPVRLPILESTQ